MSIYRNLAVLDAANLVVDEINALIDANPRRLLYVKQLRDSAQSVCANIREGFGRGKGRDRNSALRVARGEAEETIGHLRGNYAAKRITRSVFFSLRNRLISIVKMIDGLLGG